MPKKKRDPSMDALAIQFSEQLLDTRVWIRQADELATAARLIEREVQSQWAEVVVEAGRVVRTSGRVNVHGPYFLLVAFALENLFKAILIHRNRVSLRNRLHVSLPPYVKEHDLVKLAAKTGLTVSVPEQDLLTRLSRSSIWAGRYPVPTGPDGVRAVELYADGRAYLTAFFGAADVSRIHELLERVRSLTVSEIEGAA